MPAQPMDAETKAICKQVTTGMTPKDAELTENMISRVDVAHLEGNRKAINDNYIQIVKSMKFLGFYDDKNKLATKDDKGNQRTNLEAFSDLMAVRMRHTENDRDLVVMRHNFVIENQKKERWGHSSTWIESGMSKNSGGYSLMSKSVGVTAAIGARLILEDKIKRYGVVTPMYADVYEPILRILDTKFGIAMLEESDRPDGLPTSHQVKL